MGVLMGLTPSTSSLRLEDKCQSGNGRCHRAELHRLQPPLPYSLLFDCSQLEIPELPPKMVKEIGFKEDKCVWGVPPLHLI